MIFDRPEMPYTGQQGLKHLGAIQDAVRYLDERSNQANPSPAHKAIAGAYKATNASQGSKRKAEDQLPEELMIFLPSPGQKRGKYFMELKIPMPSDPGKIIADQVKERIAKEIGQGKPIEVQPDDEGMDAKLETAPKEEPPEDSAPPSPKKGRQSSQDDQ